MTEQTCAMCEFGKDGRCYWPYYADNDGVGCYDALLDPMPDWADRAIERDSGSRVNDRDCNRCGAFAERDPPPDPNKPVRCPHTAELFEKAKA